MDLNLRILTNFVLLLKHASSKRKRKTNQITLGILCSSSRPLLLFVRPVDAVPANRDTAYFVPVFANRSHVLTVWNILLKLVLAKLIKLFYGSGSLITMFPRVQHWFEFSSGHVY